MTKIVVFTFTTVYITNRVNVDSICACIALPVLPLVQIVVVQPVGFDQELCLVIQIDTTIVVLMISECQD